MSDFLIAAGAAWLGVSLGILVVVCATARHEPEGSDEMIDHPWSRCRGSEIVGILRSRGWRVWPVNARYDDGRAVCFHMAGGQLDSLTSGEYTVINERRIDIRAALNAEYEPDAAAWVCPLCQVDGIAAITFIPADRACHRCGFVKSSAWHYLFGGRRLTFARTAALHAEERRQYEAAYQEYTEQRRREQAAGQEGAL